MGNTDLTRGLQYQVFVKGDKVIKIPTTAEEIIAFGGDAKKINETIDERTRGEKLLRYFTSQDEFPSDALAFTQWCDSGCFVQNRCTVVKDKLTEIGSNPKLTKEEQAIQYKILFENYAGGIYKTRQYGFSDRVFNFTINNGTNSSGQVVLFDAGEVTTDKDYIAQLIKEKIREKQRSFKKLQPHLQEIFTSVMNTWITLENLEQFRKMNQQFS